MATIDIGKIKPVFKGTYDNSTAYVLDDIVYYNGSSYVAKTSTTGNLPTDTTKWNILASGSGGIWDSTLSIGSASQKLRVNSGGTGLEFFTEPAVTTDFVKLATVTADGSASSVSLDGYFSSTYKNYEIYGYNVKSSSGRASWRFNLSGSASSGGSYYQIGNQAYGGSGGGNYNSAQPQEWGANKYQFTHNTHDNATAPHHAIIILFDPLNSSYLTQGFAQAMGFNNTQHDHFVYGFLFNTTTNTTGVTFLSSGGNITGEFTLYGLKV